ncbi:hypothetical protein RQP46_009465 [Phenoliferia psychrophenolica]
MSATFGDGIALATGASVGIASSLYFRKYEPSISSFANVVIVVALLARLGTTPQWDAQLITAPMLPAVAVVVAFLTGLSASILHYRLLSLSHPLHDIPGPLFARASKWWLMSSVLSGDIRDHVAAAHAKYGKVVRLAPNEISIADWEAVLPVHGAKSWIRGTSYTATAYSKPGEATDKASMLNHTPRRRVWDKAFTIGSLREYEPMLLTRLGQLCDQFDARVGTVIDLNDWMGFLVFDVTSDLAYGGGTDFIKAGFDNSGVVHGVVATLRLQGRTMAIPWLAGLTAYSPLARKSKPFMGYAGSQFVERLKSGNPHGGKDFLYHLNNEGGEGGPTMSMEAMGADAGLIMAAGADTTRLAISLMFCFLLRDPALYKRLEAEVDKAMAGTETTTVGRHTFVGADVVRSIPLLDACIDEALRIHPPLSVEPMRQAPEGGILVAGRFIPGGAQVRVPSHVIQRDPANFERPLEFLPDRWIKSEDNKIFNKGAFFPFLFGPFHCVGKQFAYQEMRLFTATILHKYKVAFRPGFDSFAWEKNIEDNGTLLEISEPLDVILTRRS